MSVHQPTSRGSISLSINPVWFFVLLIFVGALIESCTKIPKEVVLMRACSTSCLDGGKTMAQYKDGACICDETVVPSNALEVGDELIRFHWKGKNVGELKVTEDGKLAFSGDVDLSARVFMDEVIRQYELECE